MALEGYFILYLHFKNNLTSISFTKITNSYSYPSSEYRYGYRYNWATGRTEYAYGLDNVIKTKSETVRCCKLFSFFMKFKNNYFSVMDYVRVQESLLVENVMEGGRLWNTIELKFFTIMNK